MTVTFNINVQVGVSPEVVALISGLVRTASAALPAASEQPAEAAATQEPAPAAPKRAGRKAKSEAQAAAQEPAPAADEQPAQDAAAEAAPAAEPSEEDVRAAMHKTRQRIEGADYKENTDGELYKKYHKQLTSQFKNIAAFLGADKPSALPADKRASFIAQCDELVIGDDGNVTTKVPY